MGNRLAGETSPYLLQHADNPVDWFPWGDEAFDAARERDVPIFLSVGYSSCHWCHVMAHESFEDPALARVLNERFVNIKVDREERPDVDAVYMEATQALTGHGGWPMSVFLHPDGRPFFAGTYWPKDDRHGMPGFRRVIDAIHDAWTDRRGDVDQQADRIAAALAGRTPDDRADDVDLEVGDRAAAIVVERAWDRVHGGFGQAPKFPQAMLIRFLLAHHARTGSAAARDAAVHALDAMARGGIHDHVAGGFHRYATDARWLVPHFEKMLYDNALLLAAYAEAAALTGSHVLARVARRTADFLLADFRLAGGAFLSATDADSEGVEGRYFVWSDAEFREVVGAAGADPDRFAAFHDVTPAGNWEGASILHEPVPRERFAAEQGLDLDTFEADLARVHAALDQRRRERVAPGVDDKVLTSWNALAIGGLAVAGAHLDEPRYVEAAVTAAAFVEDRLRVDGVLHHTYTDGVARVPAFLEDVALLAQAHLTLWEVTGDLRWFDLAVAGAEDAIGRFRDPDGRGYFQTADDAEALFKRPMDTWDNATPSGNSALADVFQRIGALTGDAGWSARADDLIGVFLADVARAPTGHGELLRVVEAVRAGPREVAVVGRAGVDRDALVREVWRVPHPGLVRAVAAPGDPACDRVPLLAGRTEVDGRPAAYVCERFVCARPVTDPASLATLLRG